MFDKNRLTVQNRLGFTLYELLITLTIIALSLCIAIPSFTQLINKEQTTSTLFNLFHTLQFARSEAIKRNQQVCVCGTLDFKQCNRKWNSGYITFVDTDHDGQYSSGDILLRVASYPSPNVFIDPGKTSLVKYSGNGRSLTRCTLKIKSKNNNIQKSIILYDSGRARIAHG